MMRDSTDPVISSVRPDVPSRKKRSFAEAVEEAEGRLRLLEFVQRDRRGLGWRERKSERDRRDTMTDELRRMKKRGGFLLKWDSLSRMHGPLGRQLRTDGLSGQTYGQWTLEEQHASALGV